MMRTGRHFLQIPGPTNVPDRVLRAMDQPTIDHRGPEFAQLGLDVLEGMKSIFQTKSKVIIYPSSGTGACEAALVNTLSPGDRVLIFETGQFSHIWRGNRGKAGAERRVRARRLAPRRFAGRCSKRGWRRHAAQLQGRGGGAQRDFDRRAQPHGGDSPRDERCSIRRCSSWTRFPRWPRWTTATTNGKWTSPCPARKKG